VTIWTSFRVRSLIHLPLNQYFANTTITDYTPYLLSIYRALDPYIRSATSLLFSIQSQLTPYLLPLLDRAASFATDSPAVITVGLLLLLLVVSMQILNFARRLIVFWTRIMFQVLFYGGLVLLVMVVWQRGVGRTVSDLVEWAEEIRQVWLMEYRRWEGYGNQGRVKARTGGGYNIRAGQAGTSWR
jgi:hypothetical protein